MRLAVFSGLFVMIALPALAGIVPVPPTNVPEPATIAVIAAGVGAVLMARRRRK